MKTCFKYLFSSFAVMLVFLCVSESLLAQNKEVEQPKLVVGIVIDQMRWDFLYRYYERYGSGGFKRMLNDGFSCENVYIDYLPSVTAIGHSTIYTGSVPAIHGITGNNWVDQVTGKAWYCTEDNSVQGLGITSDAGKMSPRNLLASTITDELALATNFQSRIVGMSIKDRGAILPAGHTPNGAFWYDGESGNFISSTYYFKDLPDWVKKFNAEQRGKELVKNGWNTLYPIETYKQSSPDDVSWEGLFSGEKKSTFPHDIKKYYDMSPANISKTPFGNTLLLDFAKAAVEGYKLAEGPATNFLAISCSSTDYVGHMYSMNSVEAEDTYLRLDKDLALLFDYLDTKVGKGDYTVFLTADHGGQHNPVFLSENKMPGGSGVVKTALRTVNSSMEKQYGVKGLVNATGYAYLSLDEKQLEAKKLDYDKIKNEVITQLRKQEGVQFVADMNEIGNASIPAVVKEKLINGYNSKRTGNIAFIPEPGWTAGGTKGATHGSWDADDTHIPLIFMGWGVIKGKSVERYSMCDISPTMAALLHIQAPNGSIGKAIKEVVK